jgi:hypothetical protein
MPRQIRGSWNGADIGIQDDMTNILKGRKIMEMMKIRLYSWK